MKLDDDALKVVHIDGKLNFDARPWPLLSLCSAAIHFTLKHDLRNIDALDQHINNSRNSSTWRLD